MRYQFLTLLLTVAAPTMWADEKEPARARIGEAKVVFEEIMAAGDSSIPADLVSQSHCVAVVPAVKKAAFIVGASYGKGILMCRGKGGTGWVGPATVRLEGGSLGLQAGASETDLILLVMSKRGAESLMKSEFKIGGELAAAAGPVGRQLNASTDARMTADILGYSRARGVFAGASIEGSTLREDVDDNRQIYGKSLTTEEIILQGKGGHTAGQEFTRTLGRYSFKEKK
jgi:lipid-binding SYLF domain-containing protein